MSVPPDTLPIPDDAAREHSARVAAAVRAEIVAAGGFISFARYMEIVLYAPGLGYYVAGARKFGAAGDFVTAPEMTPLFGAALAVQLNAILEAGSGREILELGAGSGHLAADVLIALATLDALPTRYTIVEVSPELRERQWDTLARRAPRLASLVEWRDDLPQVIDGAIVMNEVLDAIAAHVVVRRAGEWFERGVGLNGDAFAWREGPLEKALLELAQARFPPAVDYVSEVNPAAEALMRTLASRLSGGALIAIDYGFPRPEFYHPQRATGTLMGHYRHRSHADPFLWPGLCDLTTHVDFTAMAEAGESGGLRVAGFTSQAAFLLGCGLLDRLRTVGPTDSAAYLREAAAVQMLTSPAEMGELFKVIALARSDNVAWPGFALSDQTHRL